MSRNIKEIGKELLGKSLNSFHRKTGLTQLEKNNEMQDGILDGILSQVDDAYIEKTEQSNVIHLDGSGDEVVILDGIEGNTMVNLCGRMNSGDTQWILNNGWWELNKEGVLFLDFEVTVKPSTLYTVIMNTKLDNSGGIVFGFRKDNLGWNSDAYSTELNGVNKFKFTTSSEETNRFTLHRGITVGETTTIGVKDIMILEGDWTNREIPASYFEGLQSSFEEKVNDEGKYEIEILSNNKNLFDVPNIIKEQMTFTGVSNSKLIAFAKVRKNATYKVSGLYTKSISQLGHGGIYIGLFNNKPNSTDTWYNTQNSTYVYRSESERVPLNATIQTGSHNYIGIYVGIATGSSYNHIATVTDLQLEESSTSTEYIPHKHNKIKLLINEPLRSGVTKKDNLCVIDNKLYIERNTKQLIFDGSRNWIIASGHENICHARLPQSVVGKDIDLTAQNSKIKGYCDKLSLREHGIWNQDIEGIHTNNSPNFDNRALFINIKRATVGGNTSEILKTYLSNNPIKLVIETYEPVYEEVVNEYGEPILLEGYENGTLYIDSTIVPTTTVRYTPKMESFKTLNEVSDNNIMLTNDVNDNIIPYMMDVDLMIMEKEMALPSKANIRRIGAKDMTSMQKRTQDMLERLIKGKTLTEQECKTRVAVYLNAGKITDAQAEELNFLIDEIYA